jgi:hypothetical protein
MHGPQQRSNATNKSPRRVDLLGKLSKEFNTSRSIICRWIDRLVRKIRQISDESEWSNPTWRYAHFDSLDFYIQIETERQRCFTIGWDPPSENARPWRRELTTDGQPFTSVAVWDVTNSPRWAPVKSSVVSDVPCHYKSEPEVSGWHNELIGSQRMKTRLSFSLAKSDRISFRRPRRIT